ncbi:hypothetical protein M569_05018 [Genlisea aurea]|uniref:Uncharacterized protein n=1 Tax=Genlisea aurea TaxID=192259 RepID=S8CXJ0_9LAMI|nr:hypothetical protein M569_05018 [Genlisea aurea]
MEDPQPLHLSRSPPHAGCTSPEFEFSMVNDPSCPQPNLLSADELFSGGFLLPLHHLHHADAEQTSSVAAPPAAAPFPPPQPESPSVSRRWTQIFRIHERKASDSVDQATHKERRRLSGAAVAAAELNINLWPFSRSSSTGNGGSRPRAPAAARKVSSAPCSRSNSSGDSKSRKLGHSPGRGVGVYLGRTSPVWKLPRNNSGARRSNEISAKLADKDPSSSATKKTSSGSRAARVLNLNVPICIGYRNHATCSKDHKAELGIAASIDGKTSDAAAAAATTTSVNGEVRRGLTVDDEIGTAFSSRGRYVASDSIMIRNERALFVLMRAGISPCKSRIDQMQFPPRRDYWRNACRDATSGSDAYVSHIEYQFVRFFAYLYDQM